MLTLSCMVGSQQSCVAVEHLKRGQCNGGAKFFLIYFIDYAITVVPFSPLYSPLPCTPPSTCTPPLQFMSMGRTYKFFGFYISYTILTLPLSNFYPPFMLLILCTFFPSLPTHSPADNPPCDLHFCDSVPVSLVCLVFVFLGLVLITVSLLSFYCSQFLSSFSLNKSL